MKVVNGVQYHRCLATEYACVALSETEYRRSFGRDATRLLGKDIVGNSVGKERQLCGEILRGEVES